MCSLWSIVRLVERKKFINKGVGALVKVIDVCANEKCEQPISKGDLVWKKGDELYCKGKCLIESFNKEEN